MQKSKSLIITIGSLNTDLVLSGIVDFPKTGEHVYAKGLKIAPGGKSRNIAEMMAVLLGKGKVVMIGKTSKDKYGFWKIPYEALEKAGVDTSFIGFSKDEFPGMAFIPVDSKGRNQIFVLPGANDSLTPADINDCEQLFVKAGREAGFLVMTLEQPLKVAEVARELAGKYKLRVLFDPGGIQKNQKLSINFLQGLYFIKPNEHETETITGIKIKGFSDARRAAEKLLDLGVINVLITAGKLGAYFFNDKHGEQIKTPNMSGSKIKDETGCGDQTFAALAAMLDEGNDELAASRKSVVAGAIEFTKQGVVPVTMSEIEALVKSISQNSR